MTKKLDETKDVTFASRGSIATPVDTGNAHGNRSADASGRKDDQDTVDPSKVPGQRVASGAAPVATGDAHANRGADSNKGGYPYKPLKSQLMKEAIAHLSGLSADELNTLIASMNESEVEVQDDVAQVVSEDLKEVFGSAGLSEEFSTRALVIFEAAVGAKVTARIAELDEQYETNLAEANAAFETDLVDKLDKYLSFVAEEWKTDNQIAIEEGIKTELSESFLVGLKGLFESHYVTVPEDKVDILESTKEDLTEAKDKVDDIAKQLIEARAEIVSYKKKEIVESMSAGLTIVEKDRFNALVESVDTSDLEDYRTKVTILKESVATPASTPAATSVDTLNEEVKVADTTKKAPRTPIYESQWK